MPQFLANRAQVQDRRRARCVMETAGDENPERNGTFSIAFPHGQTQLTLVLLCALSTNPRINRQTGR